MLNEKRASTKERWIGTYDEGIAGPLIFMMGGIHGNEKAGVTALEYLIKMLEVEPVTNENFSFSGRLVALRGNIQALQKGVRFVKIGRTSCRGKGKGGGGEDSSNGKE